MLRLYVDSPLATAAAFALPPDAARHVQVRRLQPGDELVLFDGRGGEWRARLAAMARRGATVDVIEHRPVERELPLAVTLAVGMPANERMDWLVEKATELGAARLQPLVCERSVLRLDGERAERRRAQWQAAAVAAAEQCGRTRVPGVAAVAALSAWLSRSAGDAQRWLLDPGAPPPPPPGAGTPLLVLSGPEGGLSEAERARALALGWRPVGLGPRVLRAETAPLALLAWLALAGADRT